MEIVKCGMIKCRDDNKKYNNIFVVVVLTDNVQSKCHRHFWFGIHLTFINSRISKLRELYL